MPSPNQTPTRRPKPITQRDGSELQFANCRMASISTGLDFHTRGGKTSTAGKMRTYTTDQSGGTDSGDAKQAWSRGYQEALLIEDGSGWDDVIAALQQGRGVNLDVWHETVGGPCLSGSGRYGHNIFVLPDCLDGAWLVSDPWCKPGNWVRVSEAKLRAGAVEWGRRVLDSAGPTEVDSADEFVHWLTSEGKRLMALHDPAHTAVPGEGDETGGPDDRWDTGAGDLPVLFTITNIQPLEESEMSQLDKLLGGSDALFQREGAAFYNVPPGNEGHKQVGTLGAGIYHVRARWLDSNEKTWYLIDGGSDGVMRWVKA